MKVYIVIGSNDYENTDVLGVFSDQHLADDAIEKYRKDAALYQHIDWEEFEMNKL